MKLIRHWVASFVIFAIIVGLFITIYDFGLVDGYGVVEGDIQTLTYGNSSYGGSRNVTGNIIEQFKEMNLIEGITEISNAIQGIGNPGNPSDLLGSLALLGIGVLKTVTGLLTAPYTIGAIIVTYYSGNELAGVFSGIGLMLAVYVFFILLSAYLRSDV